MIPLQHFSSGVVAGIVRRQPPSKERTAFAWQLAVGPALARATTVELDAQGLLTVRALDTRWTAELERARDAVLARMQGLLGPDEIRRIRTRHSMTAARHRVGVASAPRSC